VLIPECGHLPQVERPAEFVAALSTFLQDDVINAVAEPSSSTSTR